MKIQAHCLFLNSRELYVPLEPMMASISPCFTMPLMLCRICLPPSEALTSRNTRSLISVSVTVSVTQAQMLEDKLYTGLAQKFSCGIRITVTVFVFG